MPPPETIPNSKPPFTTCWRLLCILALAATGAAMYWVITTDKLEGTMKLLAGGGVLIAGLLVIAVGAHFSDGRHRR